MTANSASKAALNEFLPSHPEKLNKRYFYFSACELVTDVLPDSFLADGRHISENKNEFRFDLKQDSF